MRLAHIFAACAAPLFTVVAACSGATDNDDVEDRDAQVADARGADAADAGRDARADHTNDRSDDAPADTSDETAIDASDDAGEDASDDDASTCLGEGVDCTSDPTGCCPGLVCRPLFIGSACMPK